jgi:hypothetical protein
VKEATTIIADPKGTAQSWIDDPAQNCRSRW